MRCKYKPWAVQYLIDHPEVSKEKFDAKDEYFNCSKLALEIGSGKGDFLITLAKRNPNTHYVSIEVIRSVAGVLAKKIVDNKIDNIILYPLDVEVLFEAIPDGFFDVIYLNFSDPWPKKKHVKRRLTFHKFLDQYHRLLKPNGKVIFKTDNTDLFNFSIETLENNGFKIISKTDTYMDEDDFDACTEYEAWFRNEHTPIHRMVVIKNEK